jgi:hypothetical protein
VSEREVELDDHGRLIARLILYAGFEVGGHASSDITARLRGRPVRRACFAAWGKGYDRRMLWTILIILAIIALVLFILGRRAV